MHKHIFTCIKYLILLLVLQHSTMPVAAQQADHSKDSIIHISQFETEGEALSINHGDTAIAKTEKGNFVMDIKRANRFWILHFGYPDFSEQVDILEVKLKLASDSLPAVYGFSWNAVPTSVPATFDDHMFMLSTDKKFCIFTEKGEEYIRISGWQPSFDVYSTGYNIVRIEKRADNLYKFYVNDELVFQKKLPPVPLQFAGFYTDPHAILYVDYIKLAAFKK